MKKILSILLISVFAIALVGCEESSSKISSKLNEIVKSGVDASKKDGFGHTFSISDIQRSLIDEGYKYTFIASGDKEFTTAPDEKKYTENLNGYSGELYSYSRMMEKDMNVNYCIVLDQESGKYYNVKISYKTYDLNGSKKEYPYFEDDKLLK